jgi:4-amino-4-deoxy-L-arabinose transferase-like glycosyltransferase
MTSPLRKLAPLALLALFAAVALLPAAIAASGRDYWRPDEPDYAQHAREMVARRDFVVPYQNGEPFPEKPVLTYWAVVATTPFTGGDVTPFGSRVPSLLGGALLVLVAVRAAEWLGAPRDRWLAGAAMAVAPIAFWQAQFLQMDALFSGLLAAALLIQLRLETDEEPRPWLAFGGHVLLGLAVLTKGPLAVAVSVLVAGGSALASRSLRPVRALYPLRALAVVTLVAAPWYVLAIRRFGWDYAYELVIRHNLVRFAAAWDHVHPFWYYVVEKVWLDFFPWTLPALLAVVFLWRRGERSGNPRLRSVLRAMGIGLLLLSLSRSKQGKYLLFLYPFAAAVLALLVTRLRLADDEAAGRARRAVRGVLAFLAAVVVVAAAALPVVAVREAPDDAAIVPWVAVPLGLGGVVALALLARRRREIAAAAFALAGGIWLAEAALGAKGLPAMNDRKTARPLYKRLRPSVANGEPLAYASTRFRCYPLIVLDRRVEWTKTPEALLSWLAENPEGWVLTEEREFRKWVAASPALKALAVSDSQPEGNDMGLVLRLPRPAPEAAVRRP